MHHWWMGLKIKFYDLLSIVNNTLLIVGTVSHMTDIHTNSKINQT